MLARRKGKGNEPLNVPGETNQGFEIIHRRVDKIHNDLIEAFSGLNKSLNDKDREIERLKGGYDLQIIKKYVKSLMRINDLCDDIKSDSKTSKETKDEIDFVSGSILDLVDEIGIKRYSIKEGTSVKSDQFGIPSSKEWVKAKTDSQEKLFTVKKTIEEGFYIEGEGREIIRFAKIEVYVKEKNNEFSRN